MMMMRATVVVCWGIALSGTALAQGAQTPVWERRQGDWTVALTGGSDRRCLIAGVTEAPVHQVRILARPAAAAPPPARPGARPPAAPAARPADRPMLELVEHIGGANVSLQPGQPVALLAGGQAYGLEVTTVFPGGVQAVFTTPFNIDWTRSREVYVDTGRASALRLATTGLVQAGAVMAECLAGRAPTR